MNNSDKIEQTENTDDLYGVWNGKHFRLTLRKVCNICYGSDDMIPVELEPMADDVLSQVNMDILYGPKGVKLLFDGRHDDPKSRKYIEGIAKQNVMIVTPRILKDDEGNIYPSIYDENPRESWITLIRYLKSVFPMPTAGITGSAGKTTATMLAHWALSEKFNVFNSVADGFNVNDVKGIGRRWFFYGGDQYDLYLQESGMGKGRVRDIIRMTDPDVFAVNNIDTKQHLAVVESEEAIIADKLSYDEIGKEDGVMVVNIDDPVIAAHSFKHKTVTFGIDNKSADCVGKNIVTDNMSTEMDVEYEGHTTHLKARLPGRINAYNMMSAYLVAKQFGVTDEQVQAGFLKYRSRGIRQRIDRVGGRLLYVDCYNYPMEGIMTSVDTLEKLKLLKEDGRRFVVLTEKNSFDEESYKTYYDIGVKLGRFKDVDRFVILEEPEDDAIYKGLLSVFSEEKVIRLPSREAIAGYLQKETKRGDAILIKGLGDKRMYCISDMAFGTSYSYVAHLDPPAGYFEKNDLISGKYTYLIEGVNITGKKLWNQNNLFIPDEINDHKVVRIEDDAFKGDRAIKTVSFGKNLRSIGKSAFQGCTGIEKIRLSPSLMMVNENAFKDCKNLVYANMIDVEHVGPGAFRDCNTLRKVIFGSRCGFISESAFTGCPDVTIFAPKGSYAKGYAKKLGINFVQINEETEKGKLTEWGIPKKAAYTFKFTAPEKDSNKLTVLACGNVLRNADKMPYEFDEAEEKYSYDLSFKNIKAAMDTADLAICNVESSLGTEEYEVDLKEALDVRFGGKKRSKEFKAFKDFSPTDALASVLRGAGFDVAACANNHANDCGHSGIVQTKAVLEKNGIAVTGIKGSPEDKGYCIVEKKGIKIAVLNYTYVWYDPNGDPNMEGVALEKDAEALINMFSFRNLTDDLEEIKKAVDSAKEEGADIVIACYHWGTKNKRHANMLQRYIAHKTAEMGVDAIIGTHPNVLEEKEIINTGGREVPVYYSIGEILNGTFDKPVKEIGVNGCMARLEFDIDSNTKTVKGVNAGSVATRILNEQTGNGWEYTTVDVEHLGERSKTEFGYICTLTDGEVVEQVKESLGYRNDTVLCIDEMIDVSTEDRTDISKNAIITGAIGDASVVRYMTENSAAGSILPGGIAVANNPGVTGFLVYTDDGKTYQFMLKASGRAHRQSFVREPDLDPDGTKKM